MDFTPGYIADRACREEPLHLAGMMTSHTQDSNSPFQRCPCLW
jgi:hypothetical protein